ncbi:MAG: asparagine synthase (glutamine-hydrolyzing) [Sphingobacteriaceae bacterium]|nr:asparagine synthase (glutamine-hydrolyzing) [Sphingobacteriaceae bacterium]
MCGITGLVLKNKNSFNLKDTVFKASQAIKHRGPDGEGFLLVGDVVVPCSSKDTPQLKAGLNYIPQKNISEANGDFHLALAHRRLSILDLSESGHQPMALQDGKLWITYNGEIYNYLELKKELESEGAQFVSTSDTEVVLNAYKYWGVDCLDKFNGMWSFCIYDEEKQELFCSRDRFGVKPFYYIDNDNTCAFASEQKALVNSGLVKAEINQKALHDYLVNNRMEQEESNFFEGINELWPGYYLKYNLKNHTFNTNCYFKLNPDYDYSTDLQSNEELIGEVKEKLTNAVNLRLRSDVPVGSCLSGGIDSSALAVLMEQKNPIYLFTSVFKNDSSDESHFANLVAKKVNSIHKTIEPTQEGLFKELETLVYSQDVPIWDTSTYAQYKVMELAKQNNIKVVLDGQGADELFAGYHHHFVAKWNYLLSYGNVFGFMRELNQSKKTIDSPFSLFVKEKIKSHYNSHLKGIENYFDSSFVNSHKIHNPTKYFDKVNNQLAYDITTARLKAFLKCEDRCGMWHSVESRTPFSDDIELINLMFSINGTRKIQNGVSKYFLREAVKDKLPNEIYTRYDKKGFETPMNKWISGNYKMIFDSLNATDFQFMKLDVLKQQFDSGKAGSKEIKLLYKLYVLALWRNSFC